MSVLVETIHSKPGVTRRTYDLMPYDSGGRTIKSETIITRPRSTSPQRKSSNEKKITDILVRMTLEREELENELQRYKKLYNQRKRESINLQNDNNALQNSLQRERDLVVDVEREKAKVRDNYERKNNALLIENDDLKKRLEDRERDLFDKDAIIDRLDREVVAAQKSAETMHESMGALLDENRRLIAELERLRRSGIINLNTSISLGNDGENSNYEDSSYEIQTYGEDRQRKKKTTTWGGRSSSPSLHARSPGKTIINTKILTDGASYTSSRSSPKVTTSVTTSPYRSHIPSGSYSDM